MQVHKPFAVTALVLIVILGPGSTPAIKAGDLFGHRTAPEATVQMPLTLADLAILVDDLDRQLFNQGAIAVKAPDVWGQNRMTKYRVEYEQEMLKEVTLFKDTLNAAIRRADTAVLTSATSLGIALPQGAGRGRRGAAPVSATAATSSSSASTTPSVVIPTPGALADPLLTSISSRLDALTATVQKLPATTVPADAIGLEPTIHIDEKSNYLDHLHELRRLHSGDDLTDAPGYGLYLVRMPVSLLPGPQVRKGKGAVVTVQTRHMLSPDLLANTFRDVAIMDTAYQLSPVVLRERHADLTLASARSKVKAAAEEAAKAAKNAETAQTAILAQPAESFWGQVVQQLSEAHDMAVKAASDAVTAANTAAKAASDAANVQGAAADDMSKVAATTSKTAKAATDAAQAVSKVVEALRAAKVARLEPQAMHSAAEALKATDAATKAAAQAQADSLAALAQYEVLKLQAPPSTIKTIAEVNATGSHQSLKASPQIVPAPQAPAMVIPGQSAAFSGAIASSEAKLVYGEQIASLTKGLQENELDSYRHDPSVISWLMSELGAAHRFMREQARNGMLADLFGPNQFLIFDQVVQQRNYKQLEQLRKAFISELVLRRMGCRFDRLAYADPNQPSSDGSGKTYRQSVDDYVEIHKQPLDILVYALVVQATFVNRQLKQDISLMAERKGCPCPDLDALNFFDLFPSEEAKQAFSTYVECKWPIHVFALDPAIDQQNVLDIFSARSELQLALAVALSTGQVNFDNATKYARQIQTDIDSIALNRTAIGFGAGDATFGWRFLPRVQSPPTPSNIRRVAGLLIGSGGYSQSYIDKNRRIEPGPRECVALIVVPNFVPAIQFTSIASWFDYTGHHASQTTETSGMLALSHKVQMAKLALENVCDSGQYRPGEVSRVGERIAQLEAQLPSQDYRVPLPNEGDLSGSELFTSNGAQLSPRLLTWYGEPPKEGQASTIFLLGTNFSVHETQVVAGTVRLDSSSDPTKEQFRLMSRNVMQISIPANAVTASTNDNRKVIDVHVASPNGISNHLFVEVIPKADDKANPPRKLTTTVTTTTSSDLGPATSTTTTLETTEPGIILPPATILPLGTNLPPGTSLAVPPPSGNPGTIPPAAAPAGGSNSAAPSPAVPSPATAPPSASTGNPKLSALSEAFPEMRAKPVHVSPTSAGETPAQTALRNPLPPGTGQKTPPDVTTPDSVKNSEPDRALKRSLLSRLRFRPS